MTVYTSRDLSALLLAGLFALTSPSFSAAAADPSLMFKVGSGEIITLRGLVADLKGVDILTVGEQHNNPHHHQVQLAVINALHEAGVKLAIGFEMFSAESQPELDRWVSGQGTEDDFFAVYSRDWQIGWYPLYRDIFLYAREHEVPMVGLNVDRQIVTQVARQGFGSLSAEQRGKIKVLSCNIDPEYRKVLMSVLGQKGDSGAVFDRFCEAQVVWDTAMALNAIDYLKRNEGTLMVIIAGTFHAWNRGIPMQVTGNSKLKVRAMMPAEESGFFSYNVVTDEADYVWWVD